MSREQHWTELLASLVRRVGSALVDQLEEEVQAQFVMQLERPKIQERRAAVQHVQRTLDVDVPQIPRGEKAALEPLLRRVLELADSKSFLEGLQKTLELHEFTAIERLVLLNRLTPDSLIEIHLFDESKNEPAPRKLCLVPDLEESVDAGELS